MKILLSIFTVTLGLTVLTYVGLWLRYFGKYSVAITVAGDPTLPFIEVNGYRFHGETFGDPSNPVVIVVHGGPGWDYRSLLPLKALADHYFVVFYDQRSSGLSPRVDAAQLTLESSLEDLNAIVDKYRGDGRVYLIGHSWGAMLATAYLGREPGKVNGAVLAEPGFLTNETFAQSGLRLGPRWEASYLWFATVKWFESRHIKGPDDDAAKDYFLGEVAADANPEYYCDGVIPPQGKLRWRAGATAMSAVVTSTMSKEGTFTVDFTQGLQQFTRPVLLLASECNILIGIEQQKRHQRFFPKSELKVIAQSGHMMFSEQPRISVQITRDYLDALQK